MATLERVMNGGRDENGLKKSSVLPSGKITSTRRHAAQRSNLFGLSNAEIRDGKRIVNVDSSIIYIREGSRERLQDGPL